MKINLHTHSNYSLDGEFEPNELINILKNNNYDIVSITDHDTCEAYKEIEPDSNIKIITGMEADAIVNDHTYDFLCYGFNLNPVLEYSKTKYETVEKRQQKIFNKLVELCEEKGIKLKYLESYNPHKEYAHSALFRMLDKDFLNENNISTAGDLYRLGTVDKEFPLYIDMHIVWPDIKELLDVIHAQGGKVFIAHPYRYNKDVNEVLNDIKAYVDGIEICNNPNSKEEVEYLYQFAKNNNFLVSCGSDYHGNNRFSIDCEYLTDEMLKDILSWLK